jgi:hypothetical protein
MDIILRFLIGGIVVSVFCNLRRRGKAGVLRGRIRCGAHHCARYTGADNAQTWGRVCGNRGKVDGSWRRRIFRVRVCGELCANPLAPESTDDSDSGFARMVCNGRHALGALVADHYGPVLGGLFLAFPGIFPAGVSLVEKHKTLRETEGKLGVWSAREQASVEATGTSVGTLGLMGFAVVLWQGLPTHNFLLMLFTATGTWIAVSSLFWWTRERM